MMSGSDQIRCGDAVIHIPSGEEWPVAYADYETGYLAWSGWPEGRAKIEDCERVRIASDKEHMAHVMEWVGGSSPDHRRAVVKRLYAGNQMS